MSDELSAVSDVHFDRATRTLRIRFENEDVYEYADVPEHLYDELARSATPDDFFRANIRDEFIGTRACDVDLADMAHERREDELLGSPLAEQLTDAPSDRQPPQADDEPARATHHTWVVDVLDDDAVAVEVDGRRITPIPRWLLPANIRDGEVLRVTHARSGARSSLVIEVDPTATKSAFRHVADSKRDSASYGGADGAT